MKRGLIALILALLILPESTGAATRQKRLPKRPKAVPEQTIDRDADADRDKDRPKRGPNVKTERKSLEDGVPARPGPIPVSKPIELQLKRGASRRFDLRALPARRPASRERPELELPETEPVMIEGNHLETPVPVEPRTPTINAPAPPANIVFEGLDREFWGAGSPPDTTGDVGPQYYIQAVNTSVGVYDKAGNQQAAFTFDTLMSQGNFGNLCDTDNFGDPVVLYDTFEDRWVLTDFAFLTDGGGNPLGPAYQCFAVSQTSNPLTGGWHFYSIQITDGLHDYEKLGVWTDGIYMSANMFGFGAGGTFQTARAWAFNKMQMYAGSPTVQVVAFNVTGGESTVIPSNARLQTGTPPPGRPNLFLSSSSYLNALSIYKFHVDWNSISLSTFTGPDLPVAATSWPNAAVANVPQPSTGNLLEALQFRAMIQNQYTNMGGTESLWVPHTVRRANTAGFAAPRWYQVDVTGGNVNPNLPQAATWDPDAANVMHRWVPSLALDRMGNLAMGYSISNNTTMFPSIAYAGRLAGDPINTFSQTETMMFTGTASQTTSTRWGDYSTMTLDPDGCTFWYTNEYANPADQTAAKRWKTKIGSFAYPSCTPVGAGGTITGTVTETPGGAPVSGATITFGARSTTTNGSGVYSFLNIPAGTYPSISATKPGYSTDSATSIVVTDGGTTIEDFVLSLAPTSACLTDTTQADFETGVITNLDVATAPGDVTLVNIAVDQQNQAGTTTGTGFGTPNWTGQTFIPSVSGQLLRVESTIFCNGCGTTPPNLTLSVRATAAGLPTGADLASVTIPGTPYGSGASVTFMATFGAPATLTAGTQYAIIMRPVSAPAGSGYFWIRSSPSTYANGSRVLSADNGGTWTADATRDYNFKAVMAGPYNPTTGNLVSSTKDSNPLGGLTAIWSSLAWTGTTPANTTLQFQVAGSNNVNGPFNFVGPDGTAGTFYTSSPGTLGPIYNLRYAKYKAYLATTNNTATPVLSDVTMCVNNVDCSSVAATITPTPTPVCDNSTGNTASGPAGMTSYSWSITNGTITSATNIESITYTAGASGNVQLTLSIVSPSGCQASSSVNVPISTTPAQPTITPGGPTTFCQGGSVTLTSSSATGNQWYLDGNPIGGETNTTLIVTASGSYTVVASNGACASAPSAATVVTVNPLPATPTITPGGPTTFCAGGSVTLTSSAASGNQWYLNGNPIGGETGTTLVVTASGDYTVTTTDGNSCTSAASAATTVTVNPIPNQPTITPGGPTTFCQGGSVTLTSNAASGNQWYLNGNPIGGATNQNYIATASGNYTVVVTELGCPSPASAATSVTVNPLPATPTITPGGPTTFCQGGSVTLTSSAASGNQWYLNGNPIGGQTATTLVVTASGSYTVTTTDGNSCTSAASAATVVTVNPIPATPTITPGGPTTFCSGGSVTLTSSSATGNQWYLNGNPIGGATNQNYVATASGNYTVVVTASGCSSAPSSATTVTVNPTPAQPTITPGGPTTFCTGGSVTLTSSSASGNQWYLNGNPIGGATSQAYVASVAGDYTVVVTASGCSSPASAVTTVTINAIPDATITAPGSVVSGSTGNNASVPNAGGGATYSWSITGGTITGGTGTNAITFTAGAVGTLTLNVTVTANGCSDSDSANVTVTAAPPTVTVTSVSPNTGSSLGGTNVTISGTGFNAGATVTFGGTAATNVVVVNATTITAKTPAHAAGAVNVTVTNTNTSTGTLTNGFTYFQQNFDANGDSMIDPSDIFYLINYLFLGGPAPAGTAGPVMSGDANGDGMVDPSDIFYLVFYLFAGGPAPHVATPGAVTTLAVGQPVAGQLSLGRATLRNDRWVVPVIATLDRDSAVPQAMSLRVRFEGDANDVTIRRAGALAPVFEVSRGAEDSMSYLVAFGKPLALDASRSAVIAEIELSATSPVRLAFDPAVTMLVDGSGSRTATVGNGALRTSGTVVGRPAVEPGTPRSNQ